MHTFNINNSLLPYTREELEAGMDELGKEINKQYIYLKAQCRTKTCVVNMSRYNMCYGIEKTYRRLQQEAGIPKQNINNEAIFNVIKEAITKHSPRIIEKYNSNEAKHLNRSKKERQLRIKQVKMNYRFMFAPENNWPKPIKEEPTDDLLIAATDDVLVGANVTVGFIKPENVENESLSQSFSITVEANSPQNINEFTSDTEGSKALINLNDEMIKTESDQNTVHLSNSIEGPVPVVYSFETGLVTSTQKDIYDPIICNENPDTLNSQFSCHEGNQFSNEFSAEGSFSFGTESILNELKRKRLSSDKDLASQIIEEIKSDIF